METLIYSYYTSPIGEIELASDGKGLLWAKFLETQKNKKTKQAETEASLFVKTKEQLDNYFKNELEVFDLPLTFMELIFKKRFGKN